MMEDDEFPSAESVLSAAPIVDINSSLVSSAGEVLENYGRKSSGHDNDNGTSDRSTNFPQASRELYTVKDIYTESERFLRENEVELPPITVKKSSVFDVISRLRRENALKKVENDRLVNAQTVPKELKSRPKLTADCNTSSPVLEIEKLVKTTLEDLTSKIECLDQYETNLRDDCLIVIEDVAARPAPLVILENFSKKKPTLDRLNEDLKKRQEKLLLCRVESKENMVIDDLVDKEILASKDATKSMCENNSFCEESLNNEHGDVCSELESDEYTDDKLDDVLQDSYDEDENDEDSPYAEDDSQTIQRTGPMNVIISEDDLESDPIAENMEDSVTNKLTTTRRVSTRIADSDESENDSSKYPLLKAGREQHSTDSLIPDSRSLIRYLSGQFSSTLAEQQQPSRFVEQEAEEEDELGNIVESMDLQEEKNLDQDKMLLEIRGMIDDRNTINDSQRVKELYLKQNLEEDFEEADELIDLLSRRKKQRNEEKELRRMFLARRQMSINTADRTLDHNEQKAETALENVIKYNQDGNVESYFEERPLSSKYSQTKEATNSIIDPNIYFKRSSEIAPERNSFHARLHNTANKVGLIEKMSTISSTPNSKYDASFAFGPNLQKDGSNLGSYSGQNSSASSLNIFSLHKPTLLDKSTEHLDRLQNIYANTHSGNSLCSNNGLKIPGITGKKKMGFVAMSMHRPISSNKNLRLDPKSMTNNPP